MLKNILKQKIPFLKLNSYTCKTSSFSSCKFFSTKGSESSTGSSNASKEFEKKINSVSMLKCYFYFTNLYNIISNIFIVYFLS